MANETTAPRPQGLQEGFILSFYGDDFAGSTSVIEASIPWPPLRRLHPAHYCVAHPDRPAYAEREIAFKGGQIGTPDFFCAVKNGGVQP